MSLLEIKNKFVGEWEGNKLLILSWLTPSNFLSHSIMSISSIAKEKGLMVNYSWSHEDIAQEGRIMFAYDSKEKLVTAALIDSWHMNNKIMLCQGTITDQGFDVLGSYQAPPGPDWGWRIVINCTSENTLQMLMYNVTPEGVEDLAVQADYKRLS